MYNYLANSPLVSQIVFTNSGTTRMTTTKQYDYLNRLTSISSATTGPSIINSFAYQLNAANQRIRSTLADGSYWLYEYDALGQVRSGRKYWPDQTPVAGQQFEYAHDDIGNRTQTKAGGDERGAGLRYANYYANSLNQYTNRDVPGAVDIMGLSFATNTVTVNGQTAYRKGEYFRRELAVDNSSSARWTNITVAATNQSTVSGNQFVPKTQEHFTYDNDGNLTSDGRWNYAWDAENRLVNMTNNTSFGPQQGLKFEYDGRGRRVHKQVRSQGSAPTNNVAFVYDGWNLLAELNATNNAVVRSFLWGSDLSGTMQGDGGVGGLLEVSYTGTQTTNCFVVFDGNGNVAALADAASTNILAQYEYGPFGEVLRATGPMAKTNPFRFSTKYQDDETDLLYYGFRYYTASSGRWPNRDPIGELGGRNLYGFNYNNPIQFYDPDGRNPAVIVIGGVTVTVGQCAVLAVMTCLAIPPCRDALIKLVQEGVREIGDCCKPKKCPPCTPYAAGTTGHLGPHATSPSAPPEAPRPTHYNLFIVNQQAPPLCKCYWNRLPPHYSAIPGTVDLNNGFPALSP